MEIRVSPDGETVAIRTGDRITAGVWFLFHPEANGGGYSDGNAEGVEQWTSLPVPAPIDTVEATQ